MRRPDNVTLRPGSRSFYYREAVPRDVRATLKARGIAAPAEVWKSLQTTSMSEAARRVVEVRAAQHRAWGIGGTQTSRPHYVPDANVIQSTIVEWAFNAYSKKLKEDRHDLVGAGNEALETYRLKQHAMLDKNTLALATGDHLRWERLIDLLIANQNWTISKFRADGGFTEEYASLCETLAHATIDALEVDLKNLSGDAFATPRSPVVQAAKAASAATAPEGESALILFDLYTAQKLKQAEKRSDTLVQERKTIAQFAAFIGPKRAMRSIGKTEVRRFRDAVSALPVKYSSRKDLAGLSLSAAVVKSAAQSLPTRSQKTVAKELSAISAFFTWLIREGYADENPALGLFPKIDRTKGRLPSFTVDQLNSIIASPLFTGCVGKRGGEHFPGPVLIRDWRYWLPLCALFSGARLGELSQLFVADVKAFNDVWLFDLVEGVDDVSGEVKLLKNTSSRRIVPVHGQLIELGFLDFVSSLKARGSLRLFPELAANSRGQISAEPSRFWRTYLTRIGVKTPGTGLGSHSFRHTFADECREQGHLDEMIGTMLGHAKNSMTSNYGAKTEGNIRQRTELIKSLRFEGVDFARLKQLAGGT